MTTTETTGTAPSAQTVQVYRVYIKATPERIWQAITDPEWNGRYGYAAPATFDLRPGGAYVSTASDGMRRASAEMGYDIPDVIADGEIVESDPPRTLVQTWRMLMDPQIAAEGLTRLTYEIKDMGKGVSRLTLTHDVTGAPALGQLVSGAFDDSEAGGGGGWAWILSDLKSLLETGSILAG
ncbi:MAG: transcriptional regulator [Modestobacter sp.]|jgi:uncharacterized protein YndB with AHSA1/START domain|nr:transcriptional regulator [Modestobacter sp.]